jgi:hypothetical protein
MRTKIGIIMLLIAGLMALTTGLVSAQEHNIVSGTVIDATTDQPIEGASVEVDGTDPLISTVTDGLGEYTLKNVSGGGQTFIVSADGYVGQAVPAEVSETEETTVDFMLQTTVAATESNSGTGTVTGTVVDATTGEPIEDASVQVDNAEPTLSASTDESGVYMLGGVTADGQAFTASADGYESETVGGQVSDTEGITVNFTLTPLFEEEEELDSEGDGGKEARDRKGYVGVFSIADAGMFVLNTKQGDIEVLVPDEGLESITKRPGRSPGFPEEGDQVAVLVEFVDQGGSELVPVARQIIVKPTPKPPIVGAVTSITTDENGVRTMTIMSPNGTTKEVRLGIKGAPPEVGDLVTAFQGRGGDEEEDGDGPPIVRGLVRAQEVRERLEGFLEDLSNRAADGLEKVEERRAERVARLAERLEAHTAKHADIIERVSKSDRLPPQAVAGMRNGLERAQQGRTRATIKATEARSRVRDVQGNRDGSEPGNRGNRGDSGSNDQGSRSDRGPNDQGSRSDRGSSDQGGRGDRGSSDQGGRGDRGSSDQDGRGDRGSSDQGIQRDGRSGVQGSRGENRSGS